MTPELYGSANPRIGPVDWTEMTLASILFHALTNQDDIAEARGLTENYRNSRAVVQTVECRQCLWGLLCTVQ